MNPVTILPNLEASLNRCLGNGLSLLGEVPMNRLLYNNIRSTIDGYVHQQMGKPNGLSQALQDLKVRYPVSLSIYLVASAIFNYEDGKFWPTVGLLAESQNHQAELGEAFRRFLGHRGMETFQDALESEKAWVNITPILGHGCIPVSQLPAFFEKIVIPLVRNPDRLDESKRSLRLVLLAICENPQVPKPLSRFIKYGGDYALDFVRRSCELYQDVEARPQAFLGAPASDRQKLAEQRYRLPVWFVEAFHAWYPSRTRASGGTAPLAAEKRWRSPYLILEPYAAGGPQLRFVLPSQPIDHPRSRWSWRIRRGTEQLAEIPVRVAWTDRTACLVQESYHVPGPDDYSVELLQDGKVYRQRTFDDLPRGVLFFDARTRRQVDYQSTDLLVLLAAGWSLLNKQSQEVYIAPQGGWSQHQLALIDGSSRDGLSIRRIDGSELHYQPAPGELVGNPVLPRALMSDERETPTFSSAFPRLRLFVPESQLEFMTLRLTLPGGGREICALQALDLDPIEGGFECSLQLLLPDGEALHGEYKVGLHGRLGQDQHFSFRYLPGFELHTPRLGGNLREFHLRLPSGCGLSAPESATVTEDAPGVFTVLLNPEVLECELSLRTPTFQWSYFVRPMRPSWAPLTAIGEQGPGARGFQELRWELEDVEKAHYPKLLVEAEPWTAAVPGARLGLELLEGDDRRVQRIDLSDRPIQTVDLLQFAWDKVAVGRAQLILTLDHLGRRLATEHVASIRQGWYPQALSMASFDGTALTLTWQDARAVENRAFSLHSLTRPWEPVRTLVLPDAAQKRHTFQDLSLPAGYYAFCPTLRDPWGEPEPMPDLPDPAAEQLVRVWIGSPAERMDYLEALGNDWRSQTERALFDGWELLPTGPVILTNLQPEDDDPLDAIALWQWRFRIGRDPAWNDLSHRLTESLRQLAPSRLLRLAVQVPRLESPKLAGLLQALGVAAWPRNAFMELTTADLEALELRVEGLRGLAEPQTAPRLSEWAPWADMQVTLFVEGELERLRSLFVRFCNPQDPVQAADFDLYEQWGKDPERFDAARQWVRSRLSVLPLRELPDLARQELERFHDRSNHREPLMNFMYLLMGVSCLLRHAAHSRTPASPHLLELASEAHSLSPRLYWLALGAWEGHFSYAKASL